MALSVAATRLDPTRLFGFVTAYGRFVRFCLTTTAWLFRGPSLWLRWRLLAPQFLSVGVASIPVIGVTGAFIGMILALETFVQFEALGLQGTLGSIINISVVKQIGPVLAAVMVAGRVGGALTAELGTMRVTEQLDALRSMATDPIAYLVVPRVIACAIMTPILTIYSDLLGRLRRLCLHGTAQRCAANGLLELLLGHRDLVRADRGAGQGFLLRPEHRDDLLLQGLLLPARGRWRG